MISYSALTMLVFSRGLHQRRAASQRRMAALAVYCAGDIEHRMREKADAAAIDAWLAEMCVTSGFERIVVVDSLRIVHWSSTAVIARGEDITPYLIDGRLFAAAVAEGRRRFTRPVRLGGAYFKSLYYPFELDGETRVIIVETDEHYFRTAEQFRDSVFLSLVLLCVVLGGVTALLSVVDGRARAAQKRARRNEELAFLGRTSAELAHELKNPLAIIKSSADILRKKYDPGKTERPFTFLSDEVMRLSRLVDDILSFSREKRLLQEPFSPAEALEAFVASCGELYPNVTVSLNISQQLRLIGDRDAFVQIAANLMRNAAAAMEGKGRIEIGEHIRGRSLHLCFTDNGPGIDPALAPNVFEPFVSGSRNGTGLGLAIVRALCEANGWNIELASYTPGNTSFRIVIKEKLWEKSS